MPPIGRRKSASQPPPAGPGEPADDASRDAELDALVAHCLEAHVIIGEHGTPVMRRLIDLLLFEIGAEIGESIDVRRDSRDLN